MRWRRKMTFLDILVMSRLIWQRAKPEGAERDKFRNLDETLSCVIVIVDSHSERLKLHEKSTAVVTERRHDSHVWVIGAWEAGFFRACTMTFTPKPGCPMCGIVASASHTTSVTTGSPSAGSTQPEVLWRDDNFTVYKEKTNPVSSKAHVIVAFKCVSSLSQGWLLTDFELQSACTVNIHPCMSSGSVVAPDCSSSLSPRQTYHSLSISAVSQPAFSLPFFQIQHLRLLQCHLGKPTLRFTLAS